VNSHSKPPPTFVGFPPSLFDGFTDPDMMAEGRLRTNLHDQNHPRIATVFAFDEPYRAAATVTEIDNAG